MSSSSSSATRRIEEENPPLTGMNLEFQNLEERIIAEGTTQLRSVPVPLISDIVGCDITLEDIQSVKKELLNQGVDLKKDVNKNQNLPWVGAVNPLIHFCVKGNLLIIRILFLIGADCTKLCKNRLMFPMHAAAEGHLDICKWLFKYGGDAKYQINKETPGGRTPLQASYFSWHHEIDKNNGKICRWLLLNGGGQHLSNKAMRLLRIKGKEQMNSNLLVMWMRKNIQLHDTFILFLCGTTTMIATSTSSSEPHPKRSLQILGGQPGINELIGDYIGLLRGKEFRMLEEFNELVIEYNNTDESSSDGSNEFFGWGGGYMIPIVVAMVAVAVVVIGMVIRTEGM